MDTKSFVKTLTQPEQLQYCIELCSTKLEELREEEKVLVWGFVFDNYVEEYFRSFEGVCTYAKSRFPRIANGYKPRYQEFSIKTTYFRLSELEELGVKP